MGSRRDLKPHPEAPVPADDADRAVTFRGNFSHSIDDKGRVSLPVDFRKILQPDAAGGAVKASPAPEPRVVVTNYISEGSRCLEGFSLRAWEQFERKLREKSRFSAKLQRLENFYLSRASECVLDGSGRILIPNHLRSYAGLEKEVTFTASIHGFRLWDSRVWTVIFAEAEKALMDNPDLFADIDL